MSAGSFGNSLSTVVPLTCSPPAHKVLARIAADRVEV